MRPQLIVSHRRNATSRLDYLGLVAASRWCTYDDGRGELPSERVAGLTEPTSPVVPQARRWAPNAAKGDRAAALRLQSYKAENC